MAEENDEEEFRQELRVRMLELVSSGLDVKSPKFRNAKIQNVKNSLEDPEGRKLLADEWKGPCRF